jgi:excisionase family DNA binding protein
MNLKSAAHRLGVHYQTAYRYVRSGELVAVRVGSGYAISEAAVEILRSRLAATEASRVRQPRVEVSADRAFEAELDELIESATLSAQPVFDLITRWLATNVGEVCVLRLLSDDGEHAPVVAWFDADPTSRGVFGAYVSAAVPRADQGLSGATLANGRSVVEHHASPRDFERLLPQQFRQYSEQLVFQSFVSVPIMSASGRVVGALTVARRYGRRPFGDDVVATVQQLAGKMAEAIARVERFSAAWVARDTMHESLEHLFALDPSLTIDDLVEVVLDLFDDSIAEAVFDTSRRLVAANTACMERFGLSEATLSDVRLGSGRVPPCPLFGIEEFWNGLLYGHSDFVTVPGAVCAPGAPDAPGVHWVVVRRPDASPAAVVAACEPEAALAADSLADLIGRPSCWGLCLGQAEEQVTV